MMEWLERIADLFPSPDPVAANEPENGLKIERRFMLGAPALLAASFILGRPSQASAEDLPFDEATRRMSQLAKPMIADANRNEEEYLFQIASLASTIKQYPEAQFGEAFKKVMWAAMSYRGPGIAVIQWRMEPNTSYQAHNHPGYSALTVGIRGDCRMRNFDYVGKPPAFDSKERFLIRETQNTVLREGTVTSMMSTTRDNIHELHAGKDGVLGADIITRVVADQGFAFLDIEAKPRDAAQATYEAVWGEGEHQGVGV
jgi:hypothetical protein